jgi:homeobox protein cut-like
VLAVQEEQLEQAVSNAAAETDAKLVQEMQQREESLSNALLEARASLGNMQRLHQASQNQLFTIQSQTEEQEVSQCAAACCMHHCYVLVVSWRLQ